MSEAPRYSVVAQTYLDRLYEPGDTVSGYTGPPNRALKPLNSAAEHAVEAESAARKARVGRVLPGSPASFDKAAGLPVGETRVGELEAQVSDLQALLTAAGETIADGRLRFMEYETDLANAKAQLEAANAELEAAAETFEALVDPADKS